LSLKFGQRFETTNIWTQFSNLSEYAKGVKKVPFDGTKENFYLWTPQLLGSAETSICQQAIILESIVVPKEADDLYETLDTDKNLLLTRKMNSTAMCLISLSVTDKVSQLALYNG
jgi:hypothetical protein